MRRTPGSRREFLAKAATILHLLGIDHTKLTYRHNGRDFRLTDVAGSVIDSILA